MKVAVTGSRGLVGSHVLAAREESGWEVTPIDRLDGIDIRSPDLAMIIGEVDSILHCAGPGNIHDIERNRVGATIDHCAGSVAVVEAAARVGARVVAASTWEVYSGGQSPITEKTGELNPDHFYGALKLAAEVALLGASSELGVSAVVLRIGTVWAPTGRREGVIPLFIDRGRRGLPIMVEGNSSRQFTRAEDMARAFTLAAENDSPSAVNVVAPEMIEIREIAHRVAAKFGSPVEYQEARAHDASTLEIDSSLAAVKLGWKVERSFWDWFDDTIQESNDA